MRHAIGLQFSLLSVLLAPLALGAPVPDRADEVKTGAPASLHIERAVLRPGGASESARFRVMGTAGQAEAGTQSGPSYRIDGGFWFVDDDASPPGEAIFNDGFEGG